MLQAMAEVNKKGGSYEVEEIFSDLANDLRMYGLLLAAKYFSDWRLLGELWDPQYHYTDDETFTRNMWITDTINILFKLQLIVEQQRKSPITITFRDEGRGQGAFFDHRTIQGISGRETIVSTTRKMMTWDINRTLKEFKIKTANRPEDILNNEFLVPEVMYNGQMVDGLLVIPGVSRNTIDKRGYVQSIRDQHEQKLIRRARSIGQPILAICGGSWQLVKAFNGKIVNVGGHTGYMPKLSYEGDVVGNRFKHYVRIKSGSLLSSLAHPYNNRLKLYKQVFNSPYNLAVNSVHWAAISPYTLPDNMVVSAYEKHSLKDDETGSSIEAVEMEYGVPQVGVQWHPEAFFSHIPQTEFYRYPKRFSQYSSSNIHAEPHVKLINNMARAGDTFKNKRILISELEMEFNGSSLPQLAGPTYPGLFKLQKDLEFTHEEDILRVAPNSAGT